MKYSLKYVLAAVAVSLLLVASPVSAHGTPQGSFSFKSFEADYYLTRDAQKHSHLKVVETLVADFPATAGFHGIERAIPETYDGHNVRLTMRSITDKTGTPISFTTYKSNDNMVFRIGNERAHAAGSTTYVLTYELRDVTKQFVGHDEIFWDVNGTGWSQTFGHVTARLHVAGDVADAYNAQHRCYQGVIGVTDPCTAQQTKNSAETILSFTSTRALQAGENISFVAGFKAGTFATYTPTTWERLKPILFKTWLALNVVFVGIGLYISRRARMQFGRTPKGRGTIVPEYLPPKDLSVLASAAVINKKARATTAQIIDLAVRHYLKIYEIKQGTHLFNKKTSYEVELVKLSKQARPEELQLIHMIFGDNPVAGQRVTTEMLGTKLQSHAQKLLKTVDDATTKSGYLAEISMQRRRYVKIGIALVIVSIFTVMPGLLLAGIAILIAVMTLRPLTAMGVEHREYLDGLHMYMKLAEAERIRVLQSPEGAAKTGGIDPQKTEQLVKLYEKLLPFAILYGIEKEWLKVFAPLYDASPDWYVGNWSTFNGAVFASSLNNFTSVSNTTFSPPASSSSSGFSGGSSSGGGGGGGGGGGW